MNREGCVRRKKTGKAICVTLAVWMLATGCASAPPNGGGKAVAPETARAGTVLPGAGADKQAAEEKPFRFVVMGDSRGSSNGTNEKTMRALLDNVKALSPPASFLLFTGDQVSGGSDVAGQLDHWKRIVDDYMPMTNVYPTLGNHEHNEKLFTEAFPTLPKEQLPGFGKTVYSFDYENARFITLNSDRRNAAKAYAIDGEQLAWLEQQLKTAEKRHIFVQFHVPAYPIGAHLGDSLDKDPASRDALWSLFDRYRVTAVLVGHEHNYNRREIDSAFDGSGYRYENKIYQVTIGGAGAPLTSAGKETKQVVVGPKASYHYMVVDVKGRQAIHRVYDLQGNEIDSFTVER
ncbi:3',5'-cyclic adenosine monophosphate phosphodiesterase CpdA [Paenibacillus solanacearum]|uniref:3',5'-cyclic adenosine monophosphate phosphodiesterase CpdA n=1 Tax=Paenibacillus solanacearum TaxID=2048548 RepID=A0A916JZF6_9BACL|nr:metallophosphoesterase [Paenibacillus solanacearum]CAG7618148.1 3',5'-cyclic adenosine monophosphate phosphodiesterase CpdA [Paenibacillus solanacearum]